MLTVLIHLGYLTYDRRTRECCIPNLEVAGELENAVRDTRWVNVSKILQESEQLLESTINGDEQAVAQAIDAAHDENTSILGYNTRTLLPVSSPLPISMPVTTTRYSVSCRREKALPTWSSRPVRTLISPHW